MWDLLVVRVGLEGVVDDDGGGSGGGCWLRKSYMPGSAIDGAVKKEEEEKYERAEK